MPKLMSLEEMKSLVDRCVDSEDLAAVAVAIICTTGCRMTEALNVKGTDIDSVQGVIRLRGLKGSRNRDVPIRTDVLNAARSLLGSDSAQSLGGVIYPGCSKASQQRMFRRSFKRIAGAEYRTHALRHSVAEACIESGVDIIKVQAILGHKSLASTGRYLEHYKSKQALTELSRLFSA